MKKNNDNKKKVAIITLIGKNYGNRLQNYAIQEYLKKQNFKPYTIINNIFLNKNNYSIFNNIKYLFSIIKNELLRTGIYKNRNAFLVNKRSKSFIKFNNENIHFAKNYFSFNKKMNYDYYLVGSDQVWNPYFGLQDLGLLNINVANDRKVAFSASVGTSDIPKELKDKYSKNIKVFKAISVREDRGREIVEELTGRKDIEVLIDPTMLLTTKEWDSISKKPKQYENIKEKKYILNYFLGELSEHRKKEIERVAKENQCHIINLLDKNDPFYTCGPSEFLWLEKNAFLICTDSFHSSVFAILYNTPFIVFDREDKKENMNSRIDTLLSKFKLEDRRFNGKNITKENLKHDYTESYKILDKERKKSEEFLKKALDIE